MTNAKHDKTKAEMTSTINKENEKKFNKNSRISSIANSQFVSSLLKDYDEEEKPYYQFVAIIWVGSFRIFGPEGFNYKLDFWRYLRKNVLPDLVKAKYPDGIPASELKNLRLQITIEFNPSMAFDKVINDMDLTPEQKEMLMEKKDEILKEIVRKLFHLKVKESVQPSANSTE